MEQMTERKENKMGTMPVKKLLITMSLPMMASMLVQALYNIVDSIFVSRISEDALTAVSLAFPIQTLLIAVAGGTGVGVNALLSRSLGEKKFKEADRAANMGFLLMLISYVAFAVFGIFGSRMFFESQVDASLPNAKEIVSYGTSYLQICLIFSFGIMLEMMLERILQATGKTFFTMITQGCRCSGKYYPGSDLDLWIVRRPAPGNCRSSDSYCGRTDHCDESCRIF